MKEPMEKNKNVEQSAKTWNRKIIKRVLATLIATLMVVSSVNYNGTQYVRAEGESKVDIIKGFAELSGEIPNQQLTVNALETQITLPDMLSVVSEVYYVDTAQAVTGSAISVNSKYNLAGVTWKIDESQSSSATFDATVKGRQYTYVPVLPEKDNEGNSIRLADGVSLPKISVQIKAAAVVSVTTGGTTTGFATFAEALTAIQGTTTAELKLLSDATSDDFTIASGKTVTIDLNGNDLTCNKITVDNGAILTMNDSSGNNSGTLNGAIFTNGELNVTGGTYFYTGSSANYFNYYKCTIFADTDSTGTISGGVFRRNGSDNAYVALEYMIGSKLKLHGGTFDMIDVINFNTADKLPIGYCLQDNKGASLDYPTAQRCFDVTVIKCENHVYSGLVCRYCRCDNPSYIGAAQVTIDGVTTKYNDLATAFSAANGSAATITLFEDVNTDNLTLTSGVITIDLNGKKIQSGNSSILNINGADVTLKKGTIKHVDRKAAITVNSGTLSLQSDVSISSYLDYSYGLGIYGGTVTIDGASFIDGDRSICLSGGNLTINDGQFNGWLQIDGGTVSLKGGTYTSVRTGDSRCVFDLLAEGYAYRSSTEDKGCYNYANDKIISNVTAEEIPVKITAQPQNVSVTYGYTTAPTLSVTAEKTATATGEISYQWYRVKSGSEASDTAIGTKSNSLTVPTGLNAGTYSFYCTISCDGYIVNSQSETYTVAKADLSGANVTLTIPEDSYTYDGTAKKPCVTVKLDGKTLSEGTDYTVEYLDNVNAGTAKVTAGGQGNYDGTASTTFVIAKKNQNTLSITTITGKKYLDSAFILTSTGGSGEGGVAYSVPEDNGVLSISGSKATIIGAGTVTVTAVKAADNSYSKATATCVVTIDQAAAPTIAFPAASGITYGQKLSESTLTGGSSQFGTFTWKNSNTVPTVANSGYEVTFTPNAATLKNYKAITNTTDTVALTVSKAPAPPTVDPTPDSTPNSTPNITPNTTLNTTPNKKQPDTGTQVKKVVSGKEDWEDLRGQMKQTQAGETVTVEMRETPVVPKEVLGDIKGKDVEVVFDLGDGITWSVNGQSVTDQNLQDINLGVTMDTDAVSEKLINQVAQEQAYRSISLSHDGNFGFTAVLAINMDKKNAGRLINLYYYNPDTKRLELQSVGRVNEKGYVEFDFTHASDYVVVLGTESILGKELSQIKINATKGKLYIDGTRNKSMKLKLLLPEQLKELSKNGKSEFTVSYQSSNPKVATVTDAGKIIAKKSGKATITTLVMIDGVKKSFKTKIQVSKAYKTDQKY